MTDADPDAVRDATAALTTALDELNRDRVTAFLLKQFAASKASTTLPDKMVPGAASELAALDIGFDRRVDSRVLGDAVEEVVATRGMQSETGAHYTPDYVVEYINEETVDVQLRDALEPYAAVEDVDDVSVLVDHVPDGDQQAALTDLDGVRVLDPAMGSGHFLIDAHTRIADVRRRVDASTPLWQHRKRTAECNLYGVDINSLAVEMAKLCVRLTILDAVPVTEDGRPAVTPEAITV